MKNFIQLLKSLKTPAKYLLYIFVFLVIVEFIWNYINLKTNLLENEQEVASGKETSEFSAKILQPRLHNPHKYRPHRFLAPHFAYTHQLT